MSLFLFYKEDTYSERNTGHFDPEDILRTNISIKIILIVIHFHQVINFRIKLSQKDFLIKFYRALLNFFVKKYYFIVKI